MKFINLNYSVGLVAFLVSSVSAGDMKWWPTRESKYFAAYTKAQSDYLNRLEKDPKMEAADQARLRQELFAESSKAFVDENVSLHQRIAAIIGKDDRNNERAAASPAPSDPGADRPSAPAASSPSPSPKAGARGGATTGEVGAADGAKTIDLQHQKKEKAAPAMEDGIIMER